MFSIITCYNNKKMYEDFVLKSLSRISTISYEIIGIDNSTKIYSSAASAYNDAIKKAKGDILVFCHQDIYFKDEHVFENIYSYLQKKDLIIGLCGIDSSGVVKSNLKYLETNEYITKNRVNIAEPVETIDECCFAISKSNLIKIGLFNADICRGWHLYAVELCLRAKNFGIESMVIKDIVYHKPNGEVGLEVDLEFLSTMNEIAKSYTKCGTIYSPCYICPTNFFPRILKLLRSRVSYYVKHQLCSNKA